MNLRRKVKANDQPQRRPSKRLKHEQKEPEESEVKISTDPKLDDLPVLPLEKIFSYLPLEDLIRSRAVTRRWCRMISSFRVKTLCFSELPAAFLQGKSHFARSIFAQNLISSPRFKSFFSTFGQSILACIKHLHLCDLDLTGKSALARTINSFGRLEALGLFRFSLSARCRWNFEFELSLPMLSSIHLEELYGIEKLTLDAPRLQNVKFCKCSLDLELEIVHGESVESLITDSELVNLKNLKNLKHLNMVFPPLDSTFLSALEQLKEIHLHYPEDIYDLFEQKQRYDLADLKIYMCGLLLNGSNDPAIGSLSDDYNVQTIDCLVQHPSRLADTILLPFDQFYYPEIERIAPERLASILNRFIDLNEIIVSRPVQNIKCFLDLLLSLNNVVELAFYQQPARLFNQLPDHYPVRKLTIYVPPRNLGFLFKFKNLIDIDIHGPVEAAFIRKVFKELKFLSLFSFDHLNESFLIEATAHSKRFGVWVKRKRTAVPDLKAAIRFIWKIGS